MNTSEFLSQLSATELKLAQALAIFNQPAAPRAISQTIRPFAPELSLEQVTAHLADLSARYPDCVYVERDHYFFGPDDRLPILDTLDLGEPSDYYEAGEPPFTRYVFLLYVGQDIYGGLEHRASTALMADRAALPAVGEEARGPPSTICNPS